MFDQPDQRNVVPFREIPNGVFLVRKQSTKIPAADHYGVLVAGESLAAFGIPSYEPVMIHRTEIMNVERAEATGVWDFVEKVDYDQIHMAAARASETLNEPNYYLLSNNCEHTARYITSGEKKSTQINWVIGAGLAVGLLALVLNRDDN